MESLYQLKKKEDETNKDWNLGIKIGKKATLVPTQSLIERKEKLQLQKKRQDKFWTNQSDFCEKMAVFEKTRQKSVKAGSPNQRREERKTEG